MILNPNYEVEMSREDFLWFLNVLHVFVYFQEKFEFFRKKLMFVVDFIMYRLSVYVGGRLQMGTRPKYGFCPRRIDHSGFVLGRYVDSRAISLVRGIGE